MRPGEAPYASTERLVAWLTELSQTSRGLIEAHLPGVALGSRAREELIVTVADANGCRILGWAHGAWQEFVGPTPTDEALEPLVAFALASAEAGMPLDATSLAATYSPSVVRSTRATVARAELTSLLANSVGQLAGRLLSRRPSAWWTTAGQVVAVGAAVPVLLPSVAVAGALRLVVRAAPTLPQPELPSDDEANLVVHLLADALPTYLGHTVLRSVLLWNPLVLSIGVRAEGSGATLRIGQGRVAIVNGVRPDSIVVIDGGLEPLLHVAAGSIVRQLAAVSSRSHTGPA